jgi:hypothetical protein
MSDNMVRFGVYVNSMADVKISTDYKEESITKFVERISYKNKKEQAYEYIQGVPFKFCVDYDAKNQELTPENIEAHKRKCISKLINDLGVKYSVKEDDIKISSNHRNGKISFHFVIPYIQTTRESIKAYAKESGVFDGACQYGIFRCPLSYKVPATANIDKEQGQKPIIENGNPVDFVLQDLSNIKEYFWWQEAEEQEQQDKQEKPVKKPAKKQMNTRLANIKRGLFECLNEMVDEYDDWLKVMWCIQGMASRDEGNNEDYYQMFNDWSKQSKSYDAEGNAKHWYNAYSNTKKNKNQYGYSKFRELCIEHNEEVAKRIFGGSYEDIKAEFEQENMKVRDNVLFVCLNNNEIKLYNKADFKIRNEDIKYKKIDKNGNEQDCIFIDEWFLDPAKRVVDKIDFIPTGCKNNFTGKVFNMFDGFYAQRIEKSKEKNTVDMSQFVDFISDLVGDDPKSVDFTMKFLAHMVKYPGVRHRVAIAIKSEQGQGKGTLYYIMRNLMGHKYTSISAGSDNYTGAFNGSLMNKLFVCIDEQTGQKAYNSMETLKNITGNETITVVEKFKNPIEIGNFARFMIFTNGDNPVVIERDNTRYAVFESSGRNRNNHEYFKKLRNTYMYDTDGIRGLYEYLMNYDVSADYDFSNNIPQTEIYVQMKNSNRPAIENFFAQIYYKYNAKQCQILDEDEEYIPETLEEQQTNIKEFKHYSTDLYEKFREYCAKYGFKYDANIQVFGRLIKSKYKWIETERDTKGVYYIIFPALIEKNIIKS